MAGVSRRSGVGQIALVLSAVAGYELARRLIAPDRSLAVAHARDVLRWERALHLAWEGPLQQAFLHVPLAVDFLGLVYLSSQFVVTGVFFAWIYSRSPEAYRRFRDGFVVATAFGLAVQWRYPVAPPRLARIGVEDTLARLLHVDLASRLTDPVAAVPSLHAGWALGVGLGMALYARGRVCRAAGVLYPVFVILATVVTGNHFLFDAGAGVAAVLLGLALAEMLRPSHGAKLVTATRGGAVR